MTFLKKHIKMLSLLTLITGSLLFAFLNCSGGSSGSGSATSAAATTTTTGATYYVYSAASTILINKQTNIYVSGGSAPYYYSVTSGGGTVDTTGLFTAPSYASTSVVTVTDSAGNSSSVSLTISTSVASTGFAASPITATLYVGGDSVTLSATGGSGSYGYAITSGSAYATLSSNVLTSLSTAGQVVVQITDLSYGYTTSVTVNVVTSQNISVSAQISTDQVVGLSWGVDSNVLEAQYAIPNLVIWGADSTYQLAGHNVSCSTDGSGDLTNPCLVKIPLTDFDPNYAGTHVYKGNFSMKGRSGSASGQFCIKPGNPDMYIDWYTNTGLAYGQNISYTNVLNGQTINAYFNTVDTNNGVGSVQISITGMGYQSGTSCGSGYYSNTYVSSSGITN